MAETYAIVESGGKQYRAEKGSELVVDRLATDEGGKVTLRPVMFRADDDVVLSGSDLEKVKVEAKVAKHLRGPKLRIFKYKPKKGYRRRAGHRSELTRLEITEVKLASRKPAAKGEAKQKAEAKPKAETKTKAKAESKPKAKAKAKAKPKAKPKAESKSKGTTKSAAKSGGAKKPATKKGSTTKKASAGKSSSAGKGSKKKQES